LWSTKTSFAEEARMPDATYPPLRMRFSFESRCRIVQLILAGESPQAAAAACGASRASGYRLWRRYEEGGWEALRDRSSRPKRQPRRLAPECEAEIAVLRARTQAGPLVLAAILARPASTIGKVLPRLGLSRLPKPPREPVVHYERERPGELLHVDSKRLNRFWHVGKAILKDGRRRSTGAGWHFLHVAIDDHSRLAYAEILASEDGQACAAFLARALVWYREQGIVVERVLTDNAGAYRSRPWRLVCAQNRLRRRFTRPYRPQTNGKAEALIKTLLREWAYRFAYPTSNHRSRALPSYLRWYNHRRPHSSLGGRPPISRVSHVCGQYT
jgi:transposase InsO family protein